MNHFHVNEWPAPPSSKAFHGLAGDFVARVEPHSEADPAGLLGQFLVAFGNLVGRAPHFIAEADAHYPNLYMVLVGRTSKGRKGSSWGHALKLAKSVDATWDDAVVAGLSSGEGLITRVRDPIIVSEKGKPVIADAGVEDKRLLVFEGEFARVLRVLGRPGNTLSAVLRSAWDTGDLRVMTRKDPMSATGAHISIVGHITEEELQRSLPDAEAANGFGNRFLWICVDRSKLLPEGGRVPQQELVDLCGRVADAAAFARNVRQMERDEEARELWCEEYRQLSDGRPGLLGAMTSRAEAQVMRLGCLYALLDSNDEVRRPHLEAALAFWGFCERSTAYIFGASLGNPDADKILRAVRDSDAGLSRSDLHEMFSRHIPPRRLNFALGKLAELGLVVRMTRRTGGRPAELWRADAKQAKEARARSGQAL